MTNFEAEWNNISKKRKSLGYMPRPDLERLHESIIKHGYKLKFTYNFNKAILTMLEALMKQVSFKDVFSHIYKKKGFLPF